jgi:hypothetical protein
LLNFIRTRNYQTAHKTLVRSHTFPGLALTRRRPGLDGPGVGLQNLERGETAMMLGTARGKSAIAKATWTRVTRTEAGVSSGQGIRTTAAAPVDVRGPTPAPARPRFGMAGGTTTVDGRSGGGVRWNGTAGNGGAWIRCALPSCTCIVSMISVYMRSHNAVSFDVF